MREAVFAEAWKRGLFLHHAFEASNGTLYSVAYQGRPGKGWGPDFCDALLVSSKGQRIRGDVELHIESRGWKQHGHNSDPNYNRVKLHVVLSRENKTSLNLQNGEIVPTISVGSSMHKIKTPISTVLQWPCQVNQDKDSFHHVLLKLGLERWRKRVDSYIALVKDAKPEMYCREDNVLIPAISEALGYGGNREWFKELGHRIILNSSQDELFLSNPYPCHIKDICKARGFLRIIENTKESGLWNKVKSVFAESKHQETLQGLTRMLVIGESNQKPLISSKRALIIIGNVVLPFTAAMSIVEADTDLYQNVEKLYMLFPSLPSNTITRAMSRLLQIIPPQGGCEQQGLQHLFTKYCQDKICWQCPCSHSLKK